MSETINVFARQSRAARELLNWTQADLAKASGISVSAIKNYERCLTNTVGTTAALRQAFEKNGIRFTISTKDGLNLISVTIAEPETLE